MSSTEQTRPGETSGTDWNAVQASPDFTELRRRLRRFVFPMTAFFLIWYLAYVLLADYASGFMGTRLFDSNITVGLIIGLLQFVSTFVITGIYVKFADRKLDPLADKIRAEVEGDEK